MTPAYGRVVTEEPDEDGNTRITETGYYKGKEASVKVTIRQDIMTSRNTLMKDLISCTDVFKQGTPNLTIDVKTDKYGEPFLIQKSWTVLKEKKDS